VLLCRVPGADVAIARYRHHANADLAGYGDKPGIAHGHAGAADLVAAVYGRPANQDVGALADTVCAAQPDAVLYPYYYRNADADGDCYHNASAERYTYSYVNFGADGYAHAHGHHGSTVSDIRATDGHKYGSAAHADTDGYGLAADSHRDANHNHHCALKD
jgi:hypothetical protein